jgi:hypothetical protein
MQKIVGPLAEAVAQLKADREAEIAAEAAAAKRKQDAERAAQLANESDISKMLEGMGDDATGEDKYDKLSNRQLIDVIAKAVETAMAANAAKIKDEIGQTAAPSGEKVAALEKAVMGIYGTMMVQEARGKYEDFDKYQNEISKIMGETPSLSFEQAYLIAKGQAAGKVPAKKETDSEKPADFGTLPQGPGAIVPNASAMQTMADRGRAAREGGPAKSGIVGFREILSAGIDEAMAEAGSG